MAPDAPEGSFQLVAGHASLDFVNTLDWRFREGGAEELLASYDDLLRFVAQAKLLNPKQVKQIVRTVSDNAAAASLVACRELREAAAGVLYAAVDERTPSAANIEFLDRIFKEVRNRQSLGWSKSRLHWEWPAGEVDADLPFWMLAMSAAHLLISDDMRRLRACEKPDCRWLFLDTSKNHTRRWCDMKICGNRMKARRFKAQHKG